MIAEYDETAEPGYESPTDAHREEEQLVPLSCALCAAHYGDTGPCDEGKPVASPHRRR